MSYQSLYRKYRPKSFDQVVGQASIVNALKNAIIMNHISHAYLFTGPRGTGKTTIAKLFAAAVNCENPSEIFCETCENCRENRVGQHPDVIEIDAASNNGVDEIRALIEKVKYMPILGKYKIYIIDEVHMLSQGAFNALLKTLEEPPEHVVFILATTEVHKVIPTIISRCQRYDFKNISNHDIERQLDYVLNQEGRIAEKGVTQLIASLSAGGMRNALTILEQAFIISSDEITLAALYDNYGLIFPQEKVKLFDSICQGDIGNTLDILSGIVEKTVDLSRLLMDLITGIKDSIIYTYTQKEEFINLSDLEFIQYLAATFSVAARTEIADILLQRYDKLKGSVNQETHLELAILTLIETVSGSLVKESDMEISRTAKGYKDKEIINEKSEESVIETETVSSPEPETMHLEFGDEGEESLVEAEPEYRSSETQNQSINITVPENETAEKNEEIKPVQTINKLDLSVDEIVQLMVTADKDMRFNDEPKFAEINNYLSDLNWARVSRLLVNTQLVLSGQQFVLVVTQRQIQSREIMEERNMYELMDFVEQLIGAKKQVFATTSSDFTKAVEQFKLAAQQDTLPDALDDAEFISYAVDTERDEVKDEALEAVMDLFGDQLRII